MKPALALVAACLALPALAGSALAAETPAHPRTVQELIIEAAEGHLGKPYVFGGRDGRPGCKGVARCPEGIDCQSLIFFAYEKVLGKRWGRYSVMPSVSVKRRELGAPVEGLAGVLASEVDPARLKKGDVLFFLLEGYNLEADAPLLMREGRKYGVWHTGLVHSAREGAVEVIHARPGHQVVIQPLQEISFDGLFVLRLPFTRPPGPPRASGGAAQATPKGSVAR